MSPSRNVLPATRGHLAPACKAGKLETVEDHLKEYSGNLFSRGVLER